MSKRHHTHERERKLRIRRMVILALAVLGTAALAALIATVIGGVLAKGMP